MVLYLYYATSIILLFGLSAFESVGDTPRGIHWVAIGFYLNGIVALFLAAGISGLPLWVMFLGSAVLLVGIVYRTAKLCS